MGNPTQILTNGLQLVNTNSLRSSTPAQQQNKNMPPRLMIPQIVGTRPGQPGLTFQTLQGLQSGQGHILVKTENGQYQLLRVGPAPQTISNSTNNTNNATTLPPASFRLQAIPACAVSVNTNSATVTINNTVPNNTQQTTRTTDNTKEKCRKFLANLLELSSREPKAVEKSVRSLIQELVDSKVEPEEFCDRLEKLLNASPQPCLIGFLKKSLPLLRIALSTKEMTIDGITSPSLPSVSSATVVLAPTVVQTQLQTNQIRPTAVQLNSIPHMRGVPQTTVNSNIRPISSTQHRIITPIRVQTAAGTSGISNSKVLTTASSMIVGTTVKIQTPVTTSTISVASASVQTTCTEVITSLITTSSTTPLITTSSVVPSITSTPTIRLPVPVRQTLIKVPVKTTTSAIAAPSTASCIATSTIRAPIPLVKTQQQQQQFVATVKNNLTSKPSSTVSKSIAVSSAPKLLSKEKDKKVSLAPCASSSAANFVPDDDVNDVAAMAGVNLLEESQRILGSTEFVGTQIRSCKDDTFLHAQPLVKRIVQIASKHGLAEPSSDVMAIVSHAVQERLKNIAEKLSVIAEHRIDFNKNDSQYEVFHDVRGQLKYLEEIDRIERKRQTEVEREILLRAAKSRPKPEDPDHVKLKAKAKEMQRAEIEELRQREANVTALLAIGPRKRLKCDNDSEISLPTSTANNGTATSSENKPAVIRMQVANRPRLKRVTIKDLLFLLEQEKDTCRSPFLYKAYCK